MTDKEVGKIWRVACRTESNALADYHYWHVKDLIRKLVEERQAYWGTGISPQEALRKALSEFGITDAEWKEGK